MEIVKGLQNSARGANTGKGAAALFPGLIISGIFVPWNWSMNIAPGDSDATIVANLKAALSALLLNADYNSRGQYIGPFIQFDDKGEATSYQTFGYGDKVETQRAKSTKEYMIHDGGVQYYSKVQTFKGKINQYKWLEIDNGGILNGAKNYDPATGLVIGIKGIQLSDISPQDRKQANKGAAEGHTLSLSYADNAEANEEAYIIETGIQLDSFVKGLGVQDVQITATGVMVAKVVSCAITADGLNLCNVLPGLIIAASFGFKNTETGSTVVTLTSVSIVNGLAVFTFAGSGAGWVPDDHVEIYLKDVTTLATAGFKYFESTQPVCSVVMVA